jgi:hypothetical protein
MSYLRNHKVLLVIIGVLLVSNIWLLYSYVWNRKTSPPHKTEKQDVREMIRKKLREDIGFTPEQLTKYDTLRARHFETINPMFEELKMAKDSFFHLVYQQNVPDSVVKAYANRIGEKQEAVDLKTFNHFRSIKAICTADQQPKIDSFIQQVVKRINGNGGRRPEKNKKD